VLDTDKESVVEWESKDRTRMKIRSGRRESKLAVEDVGREQGRSGRRRSSYYVRARRRDAKKGKLHRGIKPPRRYVQASCSKHHAKGEHHGNV